MAAVLVFALISARAQNLPLVTDDLSLLRRDVERDVAAGVVPGLAIGVARNGKILWEEGFGWANLEKQIPATENTAFYIASVTKSITATAIMRLQERGRISLDKPVNDFLGAAKVHSPMWNASEATVRRLLSHTGGLTTFSRWCLPGDPQCGIDKEIKDYGVLVWPPGEVFDYSNLGYGILGKVVERSSGMNLAAFLQKEFFIPLDMKSCGFDSASAQTATQYEEKNHKPSGLKISGHPGASGLHCSAHDLLQFGRFQLKERIGARPLLSAADIDEMHFPQANTHGQYGLGWWIKQRSGYQVVYAEGGTTDSYALLELIPSQDLAVVVIANSYAKSVNELGDKIVSALIPGFRAVEASTGDSAPGPGSDQARALVGDWTGKIFAHEGSVNISISVGKDGSVLAYIGKEPPALMSNVSLEPQHFYGEMPASHMIDDAPKHPSIIALDLALYGRELIGAATLGPKPGEDGDQLPHWARLSRIQP